MKLTDIDLNNREEIAAAHALLAVILGTAAAVPATNIVPSVSLGAGAAGQYVGVNATGTINTSDKTPDPAAVFGGGTAVPLGLPALGSAGVGLPQTALAALPGSGLPQSTGLAPLPVPGGAALPAAAGPSSPAPGVDLDAEGLPWDERINASTKTKNADGKWKAKKGMNDAAKVNEIKAQIRATLAAGNGMVAGVLATALPTSVPSPTQSALSPLPGSAPAPAAASGPATITPLPALPASTAVAAVADPASFEQLMTRVSAGAVAGHIPNDGLARVCQALGLASVVALQTQPQYVPNAWALIKQHFPNVQ